MNVNTFSKLCSVVGIVAVAFTISGCNINQTNGQSAQVMGQLSPKVQGMLHRQNTSEAIDVEFAKRFDDKMAQAKKLVTVDGDTITVKHKFGTTVMPKTHQRIVVIRMEDPILALDVPFLAGNYNPNHYLYEQLSAKDINVISVNDDSKTINYEQVQAEEPDLIIMRDSFDQNVYNALNKIAPTAAFDLRQDETSLLALSMALGIPETGELRLREYYSKAKFYRRALHEHIGDKTVALLRVLNKEIRLYPYSKNDINRFMYELLNLNPPLMVLEADFSTTNNAISLERLPDMKADYLLISSGYGPSSKQNNKIAQNRLESMKRDELWHKIPAVQQGHVEEVDTTVWNAHGILAKEQSMKSIYDAWGK